ncbi:hypothetical protein [uncultured Catenibacterium sp.]|uniref:hypothetical protein n=1 Tax=uncultured Catenibacterium sp. TaxID=286142 RepID=UPI00262F9392|nr:hypothetical protein [uncultured Catenibacterium sp.]
MRKWVRPSACEEKFSVNEAVSACIEGQIQCFFPGNSPLKGEDGNSTFTLTQDFIEQNNLGWNIEKSGNEDHGLCGNWAPVSFNSSTASGYEVVDGVIATNRKIDSITGYQEEAGTYTVKWKSYDGTQNNKVYHHQGTLKITNVIQDRPNHS